jgi:hypothetical protein
MQQPEAARRSSFALERRTRTLASRRLRSLSAHRLPCGPRQYPGKVNVIVHGHTLTQAYYERQSLGRVSFLRNRDCESVLLLVSFSRCSICSYHLRVTVQCRAGRGNELTDVMSGEQTLQTPSSKCTGSRVWCVSLMVMCLVRQVTLTVVCVVTSALPQAARAPRHGSRSMTLTRH